ncbi:DUF4397 domain-containing protein [Candidatus Parcubacteria bacterium]|nr:MAG: DUF4397 domain-containing protein [Candidatus Parcubacteria bacterium]
MIYISYTVSEHILYKKQNKGEIELKKFRLLIASIVSIFAFSVLSSFASADDHAMVRIIHASPDAPAVDVFVNGDAVVENASFKAATDYMNLPAGTHKVEIYATGTMGEADPVIAADLTVEAGMSYTVAAINNVANLELSVTTDNNMVEEGKAKIRVGHFSPDAPAVNVGLIGGDDVFSGAEFKAVTDYMALDAGSYDLEVRTADGGQQVLDLTGTELEANKVYSVYAINTVDSIEVLVLVDNTMMPSEMPQTGMGGASASASEGINTWAAIGALLLVGAAVIGVRRFAAQK